MKTKEHEITLGRLILIYGSIIAVGIIIILLLLVNPLADPRVVAYDVDQALVLIYTHTDLIILDVRNNQTHYNQSHIRGAIWLNYTLTGETDDIMIYNQNGDYIANVAERLSRHNEGKIYYINGGFDAWEQAGYPKN